MFNNLYKIIKEENNKTIIQLDKDNIIFKVHFEGNPILPGACITEIARELIEKKSGKKLNIINIKNIKFLQLVSPNENQEIAFSININATENDEIQAKIQLESSTENHIFAKINMILKNVG